MAYRIRSSLAVLNCYGPYKQDLTSTKRRLVLVKDQCAGRGTDRTSKTIGQGVAESHNKVQYISTRERKNAIYQYTNIPTYPNLYYREEMDI